MVATKPLGHLPLEALRNATAEAHRHLESRLKISEPNATAADFRQYALAMYGWLAPIEDRLWNFPWAEPLDREVRSRKICWLEQDFGFEPEVPLMNSEIDLLDPNETIGAAYVIEGSQLGGQVLRKRFPHVQSRWLDGYGPATGRLWRDFLVVLDRELASAPAQRSACRGAVKAFEELTLWFDSQGCLK